MKTLTEFTSYALKNAQETWDRLKAEGKSDEELPAALGEALKIEGDKLKWIQAALTQAREKGDGLKRVVVLGLNEGEAAPKGAVAGEGFVTVAELYPQAQRQTRPERDEDRRGGRGDKRGKGRGKGRGGRGERSEGGGGERSARGPRGDRAERAPREPRAPGAPLTIKPGPGASKAPTAPAESSGGGETPAAE